MDLTASQQAPRPRQTGHARMPHSRHRTRALFALSCLLTLCHHAKAMVDTCPWGDCTEAPTRPLVELKRFIWTEDRKELCGPGYYPQIMTGLCVPCRPGLFKSADGAGLCEPCGPGRFAFAHGSTQCDLCPVGTFSDALVTDQCRPCPAGAHTPVPGSTACVPCFQDTYSAEAGAGVCTQCPPGTSTRGHSGATHCVADTSTPSHHSHRQAIVPTDTDVFEHHDLV